MKTIDKDQFMEDILLQPNSLSKIMTQRLEEMISLLSPPLIAELYFALMNDVKNINKIKNGFFSMQYIYPYYKLYAQKQIQILLEEEFLRYQNNQALHYGDMNHIQSLKNQNCFDEFVDVRDYLRGEIACKFSAYIAKEEE